MQHLKDAFVRVTKEYLAFQDFLDLEVRMEYRVSLDPRGHGVLRVRKGLLASLDLKVRRAIEESMVCQASGELQAYRYGKSIIIFFHVRKVCMLLQNLICPIADCLLFTVTKVCFRTLYYLVTMDLNFF